MKRIVFGLIAVTALAANTANAANLVLGINSVSLGGGIYSIDVDTGAATLYASTASAALGTNQTSGNSLAADPTGPIYYSSNQAAANDTLFSLVSNSTAAAGSLVGTVASGTFGGGAYWYISQNSPFLHMVTFNGSGTSIVTDTAFALSGDVKPWTFGDLAYSGNTIYGSAGITGGGSEFFSINLTTFTVTTISNTTPLQLAFAGTDLIGLQTATGNIYSINTLTGALTYKSTAFSVNGNAVRFNDLAGNPIPEPASMALLGIGLTGLVSIRRFLATARKAA